MDFNQYAQGVQPGAAGNTSGLYQQSGGIQAQRNSDYLAALQHFSAEEQKPKMSGNKPIVVCGGEQREAKDMDEAQAIAESLAHSKSADAYILKPVKKVAPKRDVVTTDL